MMKEKGEKSNRRNKTTVNMTKDVKMMMQHPTQANHSVTHQSTDYPVTQVSAVNITLT